MPEDSPAASENEYVKEPKLTVTTMNRRNFQFFIKSGFHNSPSLSVIVISVGAPNATPCDGVELIIIN